VADGDADYTGELGYFQPAGAWNCIATSDTVTTPPDATATGKADFATVPFHLTFELIMEELRVAKQESAALTAMLNDLRERAALPAERATLTPGQQEIATAIDRAAPAPSPAAAVAPSASSERRRDLWSSPAMASALRNTASSQRGGFGGSGSSPAKGFGHSF
jgi:hypothetical protein